MTILVFIVSASVSSSGPSTSLGLDHVQIKPYRSAPQTLPVRFKPAPSDGLWRFRLSSEGPFWSRRLDRPWPPHCSRGLFVCDSRRVQMDLSPHATWECGTYSTSQQSHGKNPQLKKNNNNLLQQEDLTSLHQRINAALDSQQNIKK